MSAARPGKIVCVGRNFRDHARELGNEVPRGPIFFLKAPSAVVGPGEPIRLPPDSAEVHHEGEAAIVIGRRASAVPEATALEYVAAWTVLNDVTARDIQRAEGGRFTRAKGYDTFCPLADDRVQLADWRGCRVQCLVDGAVRQDGDLADLVFSPAFVVSFVSRVMTLEPGDVIALGSPPGVGPLAAGQTVEVRLLDAAGEVLCSVANPVTRDD